MKQLSALDPLATCASCGAAVRTFAAAAASWGRGGGPLRWSE